MIINYIEQVIGYFGSESTDGYDIEASANNLEPLIEDFIETHSTPMACIFGVGQFRIEFYNEGDQGGFLDSFDSWSQDLNWDSILVAK